MNSNRKKNYSYGKQSISLGDIFAVVRTLISPWLTQGPKVTEFETALCHTTGAQYAVALANGTAALHLAVAALELPKDSEGITTPITFAASANCLLYNSVSPVFADIDPRTYNIDPTEIKKMITEHTKVIIPVHFAGQPADMAAISAIAREKDLYVIEDAAHAIGSRYENGAAVGNCEYSDMTIFSFHPVKTITTGEGGAITTNSKELYEKLLLLRSHGMVREADRFIAGPAIEKGPWYHEMQDIGFNYRLTDIQAALGISQLKRLDKFSTQRRHIVERYNEAFKDIELATIPFERSGVRSTSHLYVLKIDFKALNKTRTQVMKELTEHGIFTQVHYIPVHTQPYYQQRFAYRQGMYPHAEHYYEQALSLPLYPRLNDSDIDHIVKSVKEVLSLKDNA